MYLYLVLISPLLLSYVSSLLALLLAPDRLHQLSGATQKHVLRYLVKQKKCVCYLVFWESKIMGVIAMKTMWIICVLFSRDRYH